MTQLGAAASKFLSENVSGERERGRAVRSFIRITFDVDRDKYKLWWIFNILETLSA